jgi:DNA polymerase-3 subunit delta
MNVRPEALAAQLARTLAPLYVLVGDEPLQAQEAGDAIRAAARHAGAAERIVFVAGGQGFDWSGLLGALQSQSLFAERRLLELRIPGGKPGKEGSEALQRLVERLDADTTVLVLLPRLDGTQRKSGWFGALERAGVVVPCDPIERRALPAWIAQRLARHGQRVDEGAAGQRAMALFADRVEGNLLAAHQEVEKLALLHPPGELPANAIAEGVADVARHDVAQLVEAAFAGRLARALRVLGHLRGAGDAVVPVAWQLGEDLRGLLQGRRRLDAGQPMPVALQAARAWGAKQALFERFLAAADTPRLARLVMHASRCDGLAKGLRRPDGPADAWAELARLVTAIARTMPPAGR